MNEQKKEKLLELFTTAVLNYQNAESSLIWETSGKSQEDLKVLQKAVNEAIDEFKAVLGNEKDGDCE